MNITISDEIRKKTPQFNVGILKANVMIYDCKRLHAYINEIEEEVRAKYVISDVVNMNIIKQGRDAYKAYGKDPSRYRLAVESLYRRIVKGNKIYRINNVVDSGNLLSIQTKKSIAVLDFNSIHGDVFIRLGNEEDHYEGIGRGTININNIPLYEDEIGPFGSTTIDTERTMIKENTTSILVFIISFTGKSEMEKELDSARQYFQEFAMGSNFQTSII